MYIFVIAVYSYSKINMIFILLLHSPNSTCLCKPQLGYCSAAYYSAVPQSVPTTCRQCKNPTDLGCLKKWSVCVKKRHDAVHGPVSHK